GWDYFVSDPSSALDTYCNICNPFNYATDIMTNTALRTAHIQDSKNLYADIKSGNLPAVSIVKPGWPSDGHPASSKLDVFEGFTQNIVQALQNSNLWASTAVLSPGTKAAATMTPVIFSRLISSAMAHVFHCWSFHRIR